MKVLTLSAPPVPTDTALPALLPTAKDVVLPILVEESLPHKFVRRSILLLSTAILALVAWSSVATVHEVSVARGAIIPTGFERTVQHYEGGVVRDILVRAGEIVEQGQPLVQLTDATTVEDVKTLAAKRHDLLAQLEVQQALADGREPNFTSLGTEFEKDREAHSSAFRTAREAFQTQKVRLNSQITQARYALAAVTAQADGLKAERRFASDELARVTQLAEQGYAPRVLAGEKARALKNVENEMRVLDERREAATGRLNETQQTLASFGADTQASIASKIRELRGLLAVIDGDVSKTRRRSERLTVNSPIKGVVKSIDMPTIGAVVREGQNLATIVPLEETLVVEANMPVDQIGYLKVGQAAQVKVSAYDFTRFGWIDGQLAAISPSSFREGDRPPYFKVRIVLDSDRPARAPDARVMPGMDVTADIITGEKTVLMYFLSPIRKAVQTSFGER